MDYCNLYQKLCGYTVLYTRLFGTHDYLVHTTIASNYTYNTIYYNRLCRTKRFYDYTTVIYIKNRECNNRVSMQ